MKIDIVTIFPAMVRGPLAEGIVARAIGNGLLDVAVHDLREIKKVIVRKVSNRK